VWKILPLQPVNFNSTSHYKHFKQKRKKSNDEGTKKFADAVWMLFFQNCST
jgi:hypothetical protein